MAKPVEIKPEEQFARSYVDRLILTKLSEMEAAVKLGELADKLTQQNVGLAMVRSLMASNPDIFAYHERRWIPASRLTGQGRPFAEVMRLILEAFGAPVSLDTLIDEIVRVRDEDRDLVESQARRFIDRDVRFILIEDQHVGLIDWGFMAKDQKLSRALAINRVPQEEFDEAAEKLAKVDFRSNTWAADALKTGAPMRLKAIGAVAYSKLNSDDPRSILLYDAKAIYSALFTVPGFVFAPDGKFYPVEEATKWINLASKLADKLTPSVELDDAQPIDVKQEDVARMVEKILGAEKSSTAIKLLEEFYEITPGTKTFVDDLANMMTALQGSEKVAWVGGDRFRKAGDMPDYIYEVPEPFQFVESGVKNEEAEDVDVELIDDGLSSQLRKLLQHPLALDVLDEEVQPALKSQPETIRCVLKSIHRELGTFPLAQIPTGWVDPAPTIQEAIFLDPNGRELQVWINNEARLMYNLIDWWYEQPIESGAVFTLTKTAKPNVFEFAYLDQPDPVVYISAQRMEELRNLGAAAEGKSTLQLLIEVMAHWPKGADYLAILAEINVVRRTSRRLLASLLSSYPCFYQRSGSPVWHFDGKKVDQGFDKAKKRFVKK